MLKAAASILATIPALAGKSRLQPLQEFLVAEELILHSYVHNCPTHTARAPTRFQSPRTPHRLRQDIRDSERMAWP